MNDLRFRILHYTRGWTASSVWLATVLILSAVTFYAVTVDPLFTDASLIDRLYIVLVLMTFGGEEFTLVSNDMASPSYALLFFRIVLPLTALGGLLLVLFRNSGQWLQYHLMPKSQHTVLFGLSKEGLYFASNWSTFNNKKKFGPLLIVEPDPANANIEIVRAFGLPVITENINSAESKALSKAKCEKAKRIVSMMKSDSKDIELTLYLKHYLSKPELVNTPKIIVKIDEAHLANRLATYPKLHEGSDVDFQFNSLYSIYAEDFFLRYPPEFYADIFESESPVIALHVFNSLSEQLVIYAAFLCHYRNTKKTTIVIFDKNPEHVYATLEESHPGFFEEHSNILIHCKEQLSDWTQYSVNSPFTQHVVCHLIEEEALSFALRIRDQMFRKKFDNAPIIIKAASRKGMAELLESNVNRKEIPDGLYPFGTLDYATHPETVDNQLLSLLAQGLHEFGYQAIHATAQKWENLDATKKNSNRLAVLHFDSKLRSIGWRRIEVSSLDQQKVFRETCDERVLQHYPQVPGETRKQDYFINRLSLVEHNRWVGYHFGYGWRFHDQRLDALKLHNLIEHWDHLKDKEKDKDDSQIRILPAVLEGHSGKVKEIIETKRQEEKGRKNNEKEENEEVKLDVEKETDPNESYEFTESGKNNLKIISEFNQFIAPKRTIGIIYPVITAIDTDEQCSIQVKSLAPSILKARIQAKIESALGAIGRLNAYTIMTTLASEPEQTAYTALEKLLKGGVSNLASEKVAFCPHSIVETLITLPMPYPFLKEHKLFENDKLNRASDELFQSIAGQQDTRYAEMPLQHPGTEFTRPDEDKGPIREQSGHIIDQFEHTWAWISERADTLLVLVTCEQSKKYADKLKKNRDAVRPPEDHLILPRVPSQATKIIDLRTP